MHPALRSRLPSVVTLAVTLATAAACGTGTGAARSEQAVRPEHFVDGIDHPYLPLEPGTTFTYRGVKEGQAQQNIVEVTARTTKVEGVTCVVVLDTVSTADGQPIERTEDWYAQDRDGNVWYFGEDSFDFVHGRWQRNDGSWKAGVDGARPGIVMEARPQAGDAYRQEYYAGHAEDRAEVLGRVGSVTVPAGTFRHVLETKEFTPLEPGVVEHKYYARGVGFVRSVSTSGEDEHFELVAVRHGDRRSGPSA